MKARAIGYLGENAAADFLRKKGYEIRQQNFTVAGGEIDLVAEKNGVIVFVEVKTRSSSEFGEGEESITPLKRRRILYAVRRFLARNDFDGEYRLDAIEVAIDPATKNVLKCSHWEDIEL